MFEKQGGFISCWSEMKEIIVLIKMMNGDYCWCSKIKEIEYLNDKVN